MRTTRLKQPPSFPLDVDVRPAGAIAGIVALAVGWAYDIDRARLPREAKGRVLVVLAAGALVLLPAEPIALAHGPADVHVLARLTLAAFLFALGIGHNAPLIGYGRLEVKMWVIMLAATTVAAVVLVALDRAKPRITPTTP